MVNADPLFDITGKTAIVTGASSGLGEAFSNILGERGANVVLAARRTERLEQIAGQIINGGGKAIAVTADITQPASVEQALRETLTAFGSVHLLVNDAAISDRKPFLEADLAEWRMVLDVVLTGTFIVSQQVARVRKITHFMALRAVTRRQCEAGAAQRKSIGFLASSLVTGCRCRRPCRW